MLCDAGEAEIGALVTLAPSKGLGIFLQCLHLPEGAAESAHLPPSYLLPFPVLQPCCLIFSSVDVPMEVMKVLWLGAQPGAAAVGILQ